MADPLSLAGSAAGLLSLGIQVSQALVEYYASYRSQNENVARTTEKLEILSGIFQDLQELNQRKFRPDEQALVDKILDSINKCEDFINELQEEHQKITKNPANGVKATIKTAGRRLIYPFRESTLKIRKRSTKPVDPLLNFLVDSDN